MESFSNLKKKEVINICDGMRLGFINDLEIDIKFGKICNIIVPEGNRIFGMFCCEKEYVIPWECIRTISDDIILVDVVINNVLKDCH